MKIKIRSENNIVLLDYIALILILLSSGTAYFYLYHAGVTLLTLFVFSILFVAKSRHRFNKNVFVVVYGLLILINYLMFSYDMNLVGDIIFLTSTYFILSCFNYNTFRRCFFDVTIALGFLSITFEILYLTGIITPVLYGDNVTGLFGHYMYAFHAFGGGLWGMSTQLYGIFWEPGIYQMVLNLALILNLDLLDNKVYVPFKKLKLLTLLLVIVLTRSTTGYLVLGTVIVGYFLYKSANSKMSKLLAVVSMIVFWAVITYSSVVADKFSEDNASFLARSNDWIALSQAIYEKPFFGSGVNMAVFDKIAQKYDMHGSKSAGLLLQTAEMGVFWLLAFYYSLRKEFKKRNIRLPMFFFFIAITFLGMGEPLAYSPLMLILVLPFKDYKNDKNFIYSYSNI
ncbi:O-antigen ligase family protein [uncultured Bacteroides sp.]|uniref:O-antigen ligase family protein n=1 Tax=uncultured Bacteroides sp. TaxID=162156 RepID=UPI0026333515|nr:O-antigen ligase family protein [uncultured Bacteroides sp.]